MMRRRRGLLLAAGVLLGVGVLGAGTALAQQANSADYQVNEVFFGTGGELDASSPGYRAKQSAGETAVGNQNSANYQAVAGFNTNREESLEFIVTSSSVDLGVLNISTAATTTGAFSVKSYLAGGGYVVHTASDPPISGGNFLAHLTSPTASSAGTEQFGINLRANTSPTTVGAEVVQIPNPDGSFGFGAAAAGYNTANVYKYVKGETIAASTRSSGQTNYTITYLFNISTVTPAGHYIFNHDLVATSTF